LTDIADLRWMDAALALARSGLGTTAPNPCVGCLIVKDGIVIGRGVTAPGGRPHAERIALNEAGADARGATTYVTLEPCAHTGQTPPCADALVEAGVKRVVIACGDPDPRTSGEGAARLRAAGISVEEGVRREAAEAAHAGFFSRVLRQRPLIAIDPEPGGYDVSLETVDGTAPDAWVKSLYAQGWTRVRLVPGSKAAAAAAAADIVDVIQPQLDTPR
jgi:diaminohydroxyphosphoribosylaminopyrimidine deaminase/5-amino-6-(5-phosphoribosylamino)uracil reductase